MVEKGHRTLWGRLGKTDTQTARYKSRRCTQSPARFTGNTVGEARRRLPESWELMRPQVTDGETEAQRGRGLLERCLAKHLGLKLAADLSSH